MRTKPPQRSFTGPDFRRVPSAIALVLVPMRGEGVIRFAHPKVSSFGEAHRVGDA